MTKISRKQAREMVSAILVFYCITPSEGSVEELLENFFDAGYIEQGAEKKFEEVVSRTKEWTISERQIINLARAAIREAKEER